MAPSIANNGAVCGETFLPGQIFVFGLHTAGQLVWPSGADRKLRPWPSGQIRELELRRGHPWRLDLRLFFVGFPEPEGHLI